MTTVEIAVPRFAWDLGLTAPPPAPSPNRSASSNPSLRRL
jgi:hypothetical protein